MSEQDSDRLAKVAFAAMYQHTNPESAHMLTWEHANEFQRDFQRAIASAVASEVRTECDALAAAVEAYAACIEPASAMDECDDTWMALLNARDAYRARTEGERDE